MSKQEQRVLYNIMHKFGKLASNKPDKPNRADEMFLEEFSEKLEK